MGRQGVESLGPFGSAGGRTDSSKIALRRDIKNYRTDLKILMKRIMFTLKAFFIRVYLFRKQVRDAQVCEG